MSIPWETSCPRMGTSGDLTRKGHCGLCHLAEHLLWP